MSDECTTTWQERFADRVMTADRAVRLVNSGDRVFVGSCAGVPQTLVERLTARRDLSDTELVHFLTLGEPPEVDQHYWRKFRHNTFFIGDNVREAVARGHADYTPISLSEIPELFRDRRVRLDAAMISVSPPDRHGYCSFGVSNAIVRSVTKAAELVVAEVNEQMPRVLGNSAVHASDIDVLVPSDRPLPAAPPKEPDEDSRVRELANRE